MSAAMLGNARQTRRNDPTTETLKLALLKSARFVVPAQVNKSTGALE